MNYQETIDFLYAQLPMYQRIGVSAFKKDLTNIRELLSILGNPQDSFKTIHIAGTNGKGTVSHMLAAVFQSAGFKTGLYTSPHYYDFRERVKINGEWIDKDYIVDFVAANQQSIKLIEPSFFEMTVALAFAYFRDKNIDYGIIETGLGGRLDSTNIVNPLISVITHISLDHQYMLGDTVYEIAGEKAGIIKKDTPVVIGKYQVECDHVFLKKAKLLNASITFASINWKSAKASPNKEEFSNGAETHFIRTQSLSPFFSENAITCLESLSILKKSNLVDSKIFTATLISKSIEEFPTLSNYIGRWQILGLNPTILADSAHNEDALKKAISHLTLEHWPLIHFVIGFSNDKNLDTILPLFPQQAKYYMVKPDLPRGMEVSKLYESALKQGLDCFRCGTVQEGIIKAREIAKPDELIYIGGSSFVVGEALLYFQTD